MLVQRLKAGQVLQIGMAKIIVRQIRPGSVELVIENLAGYAIRRELVSARQVARRSKYGFHTRKSKTGENR